MKTEHSLALCKNGSVIATLCRYVIMSIVTLKLILLSVNALHQGKSDVLRTDLWFYLIKVENVLVFPSEFA